MIFFVEKLFPCEDYKPYCKNYAQTGQCRDVYTQRYCRKSCDLCKGEKKKAKKLIIQAENIALKNSATHEKRRDVLMSLSLKNGGSSGQGSCVATSFPGALLFSSLRKKDLNMRLGIRFDCLATV